MNKIETKSFMFEFNTKNTLISLMVVVKDHKVLHGSWDEVEKRKLSFLLLSAIAVLAEFRPALVKNPKFVQSET